MQFVGSRVGTLCWMGVVLAACGSGGGGGGVQATLQLGVSAANGGAASSTLQKSRNKSTSVAPEDFVSTSITSGAPDTFSLALQTMTLVGLDEKGATAVVPIFHEPAGRPIVISGSRVDLSALFTRFECLDANGVGYQLAAGESCQCGFDRDNRPLGQVRDPASGRMVCPWDLPGDTGGRGRGGQVTTLQASIGSYTALDVVFQRRARISGCLTGQYGAPGSSISGKHTYCTQAGRALYAGVGGGQRADFEGRAAEEMDFDLARPGTGAGADTLTLRFPIEGGLTLAEGGTERLTLVIDTNRLLRFYNQAISQPVNPGAPSTVSYFFTTVFDGSVFVFAGQPGEIYGYQLVTRACIGAAQIPADHDCPTGSVVAAWLTVVADPAGIPITASFMPDDDNTLTVIKGSNQAGSPQGAVWDPSCVTRNQSGGFDLRYLLGSSDSGVVFNVRTDVRVGDALPGVYFEGLQRSYGVVTAYRRL